MTDEEHVSYRVQLLEKTVERLEAKLDRIVLALVGLCITVAASTLAYLLTTVAGGSG